MARARDVAFIRKLCSLRVAPQVLAQSLLPALRGLIPSRSAGVLWVDDAGEVTTLYAEQMPPAKAMSAYHEMHGSSPANGPAQVFARRAQAADPVSFESLTPREQASAHPDDVLSPFDARHALYGVLHDGGRPVGQLGLYRGHDDEPFDAAAADALRPLLHYIAPALVRADVTAQPSDAEVIVEESLGVVDAAGVVQSGTETWSRLVRLAALERICPKEAMQEPRQIAAFLRRIAAQALILPRGAAVTRHEFTRQSSWGCFHLHAYRLADRGGRRADQVGVLVRRAEPRTLALVRGAGASPLSPQQREVAMLLASGRTNREIAAELGLSLNTACYHVKQVYGRLEVADRAAVAGALLDFAAG